MKTLYQQFYIKMSNGRGVNEIFDRHSTRKNSYCKGGVKETFDQQFYMKNNYYWKES